MIYSNTFFQIGSYQLNKDQDFIEIKIYNLQFTMANGEPFKTNKEKALYINYTTD